MSARRRLLTAFVVCGLVALAAFAAGLAGGPGPKADATPPQLTAQPVLGIGAEGVRPFGVAADGTAWAWGSARGARPTAADGGPMAVGDDGFVLLRGKGGSWRATQGALDASGAPLDQFTPAGGNGPGPARVTPGGGVAVAGFSGTRFVLLTGRPGQAAREVVDPKTVTLNASVPVTVAGAPAASATSGGGLSTTAGGVAASAGGLVTSGGVTPRAVAPRAEATPLLLAGESPASTSRVAIAAVDEPAGTGVFLGVVGPAVEPAVLHWDGAAWSREPVELPVGSAGAFRILALAGTSADRVWMLAQPDDSLARGLVLFARDTSGASPRWVERPLGATPFADRATTAVGLTGVQAVRYPAQGITASTAGVWLDGTWRQGTRAGSVTVYYDIAAGKVTGTWCDAVRPDGSPLCTGPLGSDLSAAGGRGHRSFAWPDGGDFGSRVVTDAVLPGAASRGTLGTWLRFAGSAFVRQPGAGASLSEPTGGAFASLDEGWLAGTDDLVHVTAQPDAARVARVPLAFRRPLLAVVAEPGKTPGATDAAAIAVGADGTVARYTPDQGWQPEFLLASSGKRATPTLRGVAWPEPGIAYAVGDNGEVWEWRSTTGLWQRDGGRPIDLDAQLTGVAFRSGDPYTGYAVGRGGTLLRSGLGWEQDVVPASMAGADMLAVAFAGREAFVVARKQEYDDGSIRRSSALLVNDGSGWRIDDGAQRLLDAAGPATSLTTVVGLPDGGAVAAGAGIVLVRDRAGAPWRLTRDPIGGMQAVAAGAIREGDHVTAVLSVSRDTTFLDDEPDDLAPPAPDLPVPLLRPLGLPPEGALIRETADGWRDEEHASFRLSGPDWPGRIETIAALLLSPGGEGWAVGGNTGGELGRSAGPSARAQGQSAAVFRYPGTSGAPSGVAAAAPATATGPMRLAVAGGATCQEACADLARQSIGPDRMLQAALAQASAMGQSAGGPRAFLYTGGRLATPSALSPGEAQRFADLAAQSTLPFYPALSASEQGAAAPAFESAFAGFAAPFGSGPLPPRIDDSGIPGAPALGGARTHYGFDIAGPEGTLRVLVIDNSAGSLAASDAQQNPGEPQERWLRSALRAARDRGIPAIVMGNRDLSRSLAPESNRASDGDAVAQLLVDEGASAYFFDRPDENRTAPIPTGGATTIPSFGTGSLGYGPEFVQKGSPYYGESGILLAELNLAARNPATGRVPVTTRLIPVIEDLRIDAVDGTLLRRSRPALFTALARRPRSGTRRPQAPGDPLPDPYVPIPPAPVAGSALVGRIDPEFSFSSSDPDIGNFVAVDPTSSNPRDVLLGADDKPVTDPRSGLFCAFNAGTTTVTVRTGGLAYSQKVTIQAGSVDRPCGTVPLSAARFTAPAAAAGAPPPAPAPAPAAASSPPPPVPPPPALVAPLAKTPSPARPSPPAPFFGGLFSPAPGEISAPPVLPPVPPPGFFANPIPPGGATVRVQEEEREEEIAPESSSAAAVAYEPDAPHIVRDAFLTLFVVVMLAAFGAAGMRRRGRRRPRAAPAFARQTPRSIHNRDHHRRFHER